MTKDTNENVEKQVYEEQVLTEIEIQQNVVKNLNYFKYKYSKDIDSQKVLANLLGIKPSQLTKILKGEQTPTVYPFLTNVKKWFHCSIDDFLYTDIQEMEKNKKDITKICRKVIIRNLLGCIKCTILIPLHLKDVKEQVQRKLLRVA